jgi:hypothetical protein
VTTTLVMAPLAEPQDGVPLLAYGGQSFILSAYRDGTYLSGFAFEQPVTITVTYTDAQIRGVSEADLWLLTRHGTEWWDARLMCSPSSSYLREPDVNRLSVPICHLSEYALYGPGVDPYPHKVFLPLVKR